LSKAWKHNQNRKSQQKKIESPKEIKHNNDENSNTDPKNKKNKHNITRRSKYTQITGHETQ